MADTPEVKAPDSSVPPIEEGAGSLDAFLGPSPVKPEGDASKDKGDVKQEVKEAVKDEAKPDAKDDAKGEGKPLEVTVKADEKPSTDDDKKGVKEPDTKPDEKADAKPDEKKPDEEKPKIDWEADDNPYKQRHRDTANWASDLNKKQQSHDREILILNKKIEGTYDEEKDNPKETPEQIESRASRQGRATASHESAISRWGEDVVEKDLTKFQDVFRDDVFMLGSVAQSDQPVIEAINALRRYEFFEEYGHDPVEIVKRIGEKAVKAAGDTIREEESQKLAARVKASDGEATGLAGLTSKTQERSSRETEKTAPLTEVFDN